LNKERAENKKKLIKEQKELNEILEKIEQDLKFFKKLLLKEMS